jgi:hypothetical protein
MVSRSSSPGLSRPKAPSAARLRAQRANAQLSTGPRTREGRRRSALNRLGLKRSAWVRRGGPEPPGHREFLRVRRDLLVVFSFIPPELWESEPRLRICLERAVHEWGIKLLSARRGFPSEAMNANIHSILSDLLFEFQLHNRKWRYCFRKEFGTDGYPDIGKLREAIEARMSSFRGSRIRAPSRGKLRAPLKEATRREDETRDFEKRGPKDQTQSPILRKQLDLFPDFGPGRLEFPRNEAKPAEDRCGRD